MEAKRWVIRYKGEGWNREEIEDLIKESIFYLGGKKKYKTKVKSLEIKEKEREWECLVELEEKTRLKKEYLERDGIECIACQKDILEEAIKLIEGKEGIRNNLLERLVERRLKTLVAYRESNICQGGSSY